MEQILFVFGFCLYRLEREILVTIIESLLCVWLVKAIHGTSDCHLEYRGGTNIEELTILPNRT
jgi:hypothetical protein